MFPELQNLATISAERLLNSAAEALVLAGLVWLLMRLIPRQNSGTRFSIWFGSLLAIVALPFFSGMSSVTSYLRVLPSSSRGPIFISSSWALWIFAAWAVGAGLSGVRLGVGLWRMRHYRRACSEVDAAKFDPGIASIIQQFGARRRVKLLTSDSAAVPSAIGFFRPAIVFPAWLLPKLSTEEIKLVLLHELAHLRRWDDWTNLAQKIVRSAFFFHPVVWWIEHRLTLEREMACDDMVLAQTASPRAYASSLISFAEKLQGGRALALAQTLLGRIDQMPPRLRQILDANRPQNTRWGRPVVALSCGVLVVLVGAASFAPRIIAFRPEPENQRAQLTQMAQRISSIARQSENAAMVNAGMINAAMVDEAPAASHPRPALRPRVTPAAALQRRVMPLHLNTKPQQQNVAMQATAVAQPPLIEETIERTMVEETIVIVRTTQFDASGHQTWTLCVWKVGGNRPTMQQWQSAIFVGSI